MTPQAARIATMRRINDDFPSPGRPKNECGRIENEVRQEPHHWIGTHDSAALQVIAQGCSHNRIRRSSDERPQATHLHRCPLVFDRRLHIVDMPTTWDVPPSWPRLVPRDFTRITTVTQPLPDYARFLGGTLMFTCRLPLHIPSLTASRGKFQPVTCVVD